MPAESLVGQHNQDEIRTYGEYVTWFVNNEYEHWHYTGDRSYLDRWWPQLTKAMAWLESVRAQDPQAATARVRQALAKYGLWQPSFAARIRVVPGDLALPRFGLDEATFTGLATTVDAVYSVTASASLWAMPPAPRIPQRTAGADMGSGALMGSA